MSGETPGNDEIAGNLERIADLLEVEYAYRSRAEAGQLRTIAPKRRWEQPPAESGGLRYPPVEESVSLCQSFISSSTSPSETSYQFRYT